ncbi:MAG: ribonuclease H family protein [Chloroflexi bacterium]|nr:ribonuclease H family protein [Chloroflexota bacterium]
MAKKQKYYVVWKGRKRGVFASWEQCEAQVSGYVGAEYKAFDSEDEARRAFKAAYEDYKGQPAQAPSAQRLLTAGRPIRAHHEQVDFASYSVDASCSGNPGLLEYRCVRTDTGAVVFRRGPFAEGTNNIGEFLAIVEALELCHRRKSDLPIYTDSENAMRWVKDKQCKTGLERGERNAALFSRIEKAERWLRAHAYPNKILKWETDAWGENPADYGRK